VNLNFNNINVLLIGDFMMDHYIFGSSNRMSPEAPVPVVLAKKSISAPGGAANVAINLSSLGAKVTCVGRVGDDIWGSQLINVLNNHKINTKRIEIVKNYKTTLKERIFSNSEQIIRLDTEEVTNWKPSSKISTKYDIVILSDYNKGVINDSWLKISDYSTVIVDPKKDSFHHYRGSTIITPNIDELKKVSSIKITNNKSIIKACSFLIKQFDLNYIIAKKGNQGMVVVGKNNYSQVISAHKVDNPDVTGAGDTVVSAISLAYFKTKDIALSAKFANYLASLVVSKSGTEKVSIDEIDEKYILSL
jgi:rfaE bifunctional protein kinase chain/domain